MEEKKINFGNLKAEIDAMILKEFYLLPKSKQDELLLELFYCKINKVLEDSLHQLDKLLTENDN